MLLSIIIPLYNDRNNLRKFLESIGNVASFGGVEFIFVDDGSNEGYHDLMEATNFPNFIFLRQTNGKQGKARNYGTKQAKGHYLWFIDVDDGITASDITVVLDAIIRGKNEDVLFFDAICNGKRMQSNLQGISKKEVLNLIAWNKITVAAWNKVFNAAFLQKNAIKFPQERKFEDLFFAISTCWHMETWRYIENPIYTYIVNQNSTTNTFNEQIFDVFYILKELRKFLFEKDRALYLDIAYVHGLKYTIIRLFKSKNYNLVRTKLSEPIVREIVADFNFAYRLNAAPVLLFFQIGFCLFGKKHI